MSNLGPPPGVQSMLNDPRFSDLTISCGDLAFHVHKVIVCSQSEYFMTACSSRFKEAETNVIELHGDDPAIVERMLKFLYTSDYDDEATAQEPTEGTDGVFTAGVESQLVNIRVHALGEKYMISSLKKLAIKKFEDRKDTKLSPAMGLVLREVYTTTPDGDEGLRPLIVDACLLEEEELELNADYKTALEEIPEAQIDILRGTLRVTKWKNGVLTKRMKALDETIDKLAFENEALAARNSRLLCDLEPLGSGRSMLQYITEQARIVTESRTMCVHQTTAIQSINVQVGVPALVPNPVSSIRFVCIQCREASHVSLETSAGEP